MSNISLKPRAFDSKNSGIFAFVLFKRTENHTQYKKRIWRVREKTKKNTNSFDRNIIYRGTNIFARAAVDRKTRIYYNKIIVHASLDDL